MRIDLTFILFFIFAVAQFLCIQKAKNKLIKFLPLLLPIMSIFLVLGIYFIGKNYFTSLYFIPIGITLAGSILGLLIALLLSKLHK